MRKRKPKVVWLPLDLDNRLGTAPVAATSEGDSGTFILALTGNALGITPAVTVFPLVKDTGPSTAGIDTSLADIASSGYRLRRVVGKAAFLVSQGVATDVADPTLFQVTMGIIVLRTQDPNAAAPLLGLTDPRYSPQALRSASDPWIWRRSWLLSDIAGATALTRGIFAPRSNLEYGCGSYDGPHIDAKTARIIGPEERLFGVISIEGADGAAQAPNPGLILCVGEVRVLASLRTNVGNRRNASR